MKFTKNSLIGIISEIDSLSKTPGFLQPEEDQKSQEISDKVQTLTRIYKNLIIKNMESNTGFLSEIQKLSKSDVNNINLPITQNLIIESLILNPQLLTHQNYQKLLALDLVKSFMQNYPIYQNIHNFNSFIYFTELNFDSLDKIQKETRNSLINPSSCTIISLKLSINKIIFYNEIKKLKKISYKEKSELIHKARALFNKFNTPEIKKIYYLILLTPNNDLQTLKEKIKEFKPSKESILKIFYENINLENKSNFVYREGILKIAFNQKNNFLDVLKENYEYNKKSNLNQIKMEIDDIIFDIPNKYKAHSVFICPVYKVETNEKNPPMILKCGHIICKKALDNLCKRTRSEERKRNYKCPMCRGSGVYSEAIKATF